jgi:hypothetical protein
MRARRSTLAVTEGAVSKTRHRFFFTLILPGAYIVALIVSAAVLFVRRADHGFGVGPFLDLSLPACLLGFIVADLFKTDSLAVPLCFVAALTQYAFIGYLIDRFLYRRRRAHEEFGKRA